MNFQTKRKKVVKSWKEDQAAVTKKAKPEKESGEKRGRDAEEGEEEEAQPDTSESAFATLKREIAEREKIKANRRRELERAAGVIARTRGEVAGDWKPGIHVFIDVEMELKSEGGEPASGRLICELFEDVVPRTVKNFVALITGEKAHDNNLQLEGTVFHRVEKGVGCTGGDVDKGDGTGGRSIYGRDFEDENHTLKHTNAGVLTMFSKRPNANNSQFQILFDEQPQLDGRQVVFGRLVEGYAVLREIEKLGTPNGTPKEIARIVKCGVMDLGPDLEATLEKYRAPLVLPREADDPKKVARDYRNKTNYYDNSTRSALFSWTTSC